MDATLEENCKNLNRKTAQASIPEALSATVQDSKTPEDNIKDIVDVIWSLQFCFFIMIF